ncbi:MAG: hypothetical protein GX649_09065, partial [Chloroflexi bacterium]|nr:hypothetical protein [Chloroflexota bacterium]
MGRPDRCSVRDTRRCKGDGKSPGEPPRRYEPMGEQPNRASLATTARVVRGGEAEDVHLEVILEEPLSLEVNGEPVALLMRLPGMEKELAVGFCLSEGLVRSFDDIVGVRHCGEA